jgi:hypothetical protein
MGATDKLSRLGYSEEPRLESDKEYSMKVTECSLTFDLQRSLSKVNKDLKAIVNLYPN